VRIKILKYDDVLFTHAKIVNSVYIVKLGCTILVHDGSRRHVTVLTLSVKRKLIQKNCSTISGAARIYLREAKSRPIVFDDKDRATDKAQSIMSD